MHVQSSPPVTTNPKGLQTDIHRIAASWPRRTVKESARNFYNKISRSYTSTHPTQDTLQIRVHAEHAKHYLRSVSDTPAIDQSHCTSQYY